MVSERGTVTIPKKVRERIGIKPGDIVEFIPEKDKLLLKPLFVVEKRENFLNEKEWRKFIHIVKEQIRRGEYTSYENSEEAKAHLRELKSNP